LNSLKKITPLLQNLIKEFEGEIKDKDNQTNGYAELNKEKIFSFFKNNKELVDTVFFKEEYNKVRTCYVALREDTTENRSIIFDFLDEYEQETQQFFYTIYTFKFYRQIQSLCKNKLRLNLYAASSKTG